MACFDAHLFKLLFKFENAVAQTNYKERTQVCKPKFVMLWKNCNIYRPKDWQSPGLAKPSLIKPLIATLQQTQIISHLAQLALSYEAALRKLLADILQ